MPPTLRKYINFQVPLSKTSESVNKLQSHQQCRRRSHHYSSPTLEPPLHFSYRVPTVDKNGSIPIPTIMLVFVLDSPFSLLIALVLFVLLFRFALVLFFLVLLFAFCSNLVLLISDLL
uniref:Transmembrane protein n=1 Tax=Manihot esculenta TaxID=3983 RepID=A0A2C9VCC1_MANES